MPNFLIMRRFPVGAGLTALAIACVPSAQALAEAAAPHTGMPQLDPTRFATQIFWTAVTFIALYRLMVKKLIPSVETVLEERRVAIAADIDAATAAKAEADAAFAAAEKAAADARAAVHAEIARVVDAAESAARDRQEKAGAEIKGRLAAAEASIAAARASAVAGIGLIVADLTRDIVARTAGLTAGPGVVESAVATAVKERG